MKHILVFGAGKSATVLIDYLKELITENVWKLTVADSNIKLAKQKVANHPLAKSIELEIENTIVREALIKEADLVISMLPPDLHYLVALDCIQFKKHLLTASYVDEKLKALETQIKSAGILFLCEMGLDPGIDHMSAMQLINSIKNKGGKITSFKSHCGGLVAPESDDNLWHYKISWNPKSVVLAGKAGAVYKENDNVVHVEYENLFNANNIVEIDNNETYCYYANRDSLKYLSLYKLEDIKTFIRTTLRHPEFCFGWKNLIDLKLTDEEKVYETDKLTVAEFFKIHFQKHGFGEWLNQMLTSRLSQAKNMLEKLMQLIEAENEEGETDEEVMIINEKGELDAINVDDIKDKAAETASLKMHEANLSMKQLFYLGLKDETVINKGLCSAADILQFIIEKKWELLANDKDMIIMLHEIEYILQNKFYKTTSLLKVIGNDPLYTAMAKTVGMPLGIAAKLILEEKITETGLQIPIAESIYQPVLNELRKHEIKFEEKIYEI
jgi:saccharopine dehydrogenase-like NADP-dependent oxidoreductase